MSKEGKVAVNGTGDHLGRFSWRTRATRMGAQIPPY